MSCRLCSLIRSNALNFNGRIDEPGNCAIALCCEGKPETPKIPFGETAEDTLRMFLGECAALNLECRMIADDKQRHFSACCADCKSFIPTDDLGYTPFILYVNLSMYPAPCQCHCIYCDIGHDKQYSQTNENTEAAYEKMFETLELALKSGIIAQNATWQISSGEIAIHPYHDRILNLVKGKRAVFYTNAMKYDEDIAQNLHDNPGSAINLSIDSGTPETWYKVKGVNNFNKVLDNLNKYFEASSAKGNQITLKYIILPGINDNRKDFEGVIEIMKSLKVKHLTLARDTRIKYDHSPEKSARLIEAASLLLTMCHKHGITNDMFTYSPSEQEQVIKKANEALQQGLV